MLEKIGVSNIEDLFPDIPNEYRGKKLNLPAGLAELDALRQVAELAGRNKPTSLYSCFLGAGAYRHYIPAAVDSLIQRGEFLTSYTPYQPEVSQGTLQAIFEFQSLVSVLTGMDVANASHYDGATATAEAAILAFHHARGKRRKFILSPGLNSQYRETIATYLPESYGYQIVSPADDPLCDPGCLSQYIDTDTALVIAQYPDFFGRLYDYTALAQAAHAKGALLCISTNPIALALLRPPSEFGADIVTGDGQPLGIPLSFGGPYLGFFATRKDLSRKISGRLVGETSDTQGRRGYVLTLTAREQHIRRERATSNICTNQGLMALAATIYMSLLGRQGMQEVANLCYQNAHYLADQLQAIPGYQVEASAPFFHEFVVSTPRPVKEINRTLLEHQILGGLDLSEAFPDMENRMLLAVTEMNTREDMDRLCAVLGGASHA